MKKWISMLVAVMMLLSVSSCVFAEETAETAPLARVASLKGPTSMGMAKMMQDGKYDFSIYGTADELTPLLVKGELDIALIPCNLASVLYNNTNGGVKMAAINVLGVLYVIEAGDTVSSVADLAGQTVYSTGKGTTPEYGLRHVLSLNGLDPDQDLTIEYKSEATEVAAALSEGAVSLAVLPQPYVTTVLMQNENLRVALSLSDEWAAADPNSQMITGVVVVRSDFLAENPEAVDQFLADFDASQAYVNANPEEAGQWIADMGIVGKAAIATKALPACNIVCITGEDMKTQAGGYLAALYAQNPKAVGGALPADDFYYVPEK